MLKIVDFPLKVLYQLGKKMVISDALSHLSSHQTPDTKETIPGLNVTIHEISVFSNTDSTSRVNMCDRRDTILFFRLQRA